MQEKKGKRRPFRPGKTREDRMPAAARPRVLAAEDRRDARLSVAWRGPEDRRALAAGRWRA